MRQARRATWVLVFVAAASLVGTVLTTSAPALGATGPAQVHRPTSTWNTPNGTRGAEQTGPSRPGSGMPVPPDATLLPLTGYTAMAVENSQRHVFVTGKPSDDAVVVLDFDGSLNRKLTGLPGADGLVIDAAGGSLYVGECSAHAIQEIHIADFTMGLTYALGGKVCPSSLLMIGSRVWFSTGKGLGSLVPATGAVTTFSGDNFPTTALLAADPVSTKLLFAATAVTPTTTLYRYNIRSTGKLRLTKHVVSPGGADFAEDLAVTSDGADVILASEGEPSVTGLLAFHPSDLTADGTYETNDFENAAAATSPHGGLVVGGINEGAKSDDIFVFDQGSSSATNALGTKESGGEFLAEHGLALSADSRLLFAVATAAPTPVYFFAFADPTKVRSTLTLAADPASISVGQSTTLSGTLTFRDGSSAGGRAVHLSRSNPDGSRTQLADATTNSAGAFFESDKPPSGGAFTYTATFDGDDTYEGSSATALVTVSPNGKIVFDSNRTGNFEIFTVNADGSGIHQVTNNAADDYDATWSADGTKIAFTSNRSGNYEIWTMNSDGSGLKQITNDPHFDGDPSWSPSGAAIAFESDRSGNVDIWTVDLPAGTVHRRSASPTTDELPSWSPDGTKIAFDSDRSGNFDVYTMGSNGANVTDITSDPASDGGASWSHDATKLAFGSDRTGGDFEVWAYAVSSQALTRLTSSTGFDGEQSYAPDDSLIGFDSTRSGRQHLWVMGADGSAPKQYTHLGNINELPDWGSGG